MIILEQLAVYTGFILLTLFILWNEYNKYRKTGGAWLRHRALAVGRTTLRCFAGFAASIDLRGGRG
jgi:hypothetical protein